MIASGKMWEASNDIAYGTGSFLDAATMKPQRTVNSIPVRFG